MGINYIVNLVTIVGDSVHTIPTTPTTRNATISSRRRRRRRWCELGLRHLKE